MRARAVLAVALALTAELVRGQGIGVGGLKAAVHQAALEKRGLATPQRDDVDPVHDKERCCTVAAPPLPLPAADRAVCMRLVHVCGCCVQSSRRPASADRDRGGRWQCFSGQCRCQPRARRSRWAMHLWRAAGSRCAQSLPHKLTAIGLRAGVPQGCLPVIRPVHAEEDIRRLHQRVRPLI